MSRKPASLKETQENFEQRFNCMVCLCARLEMVSGLCQHRVCVDCLYDDNLLRVSFHKCPICQARGTFPPARPEIPEDNMEMMRCLGVRVCPDHDSGCTAQMWEWEIEDHLRTCHWKKVPPEDKAEVFSPKSRSSTKKTKVAGKRPVTRSSGNVYNFRSHSLTK